MDIKTLLVVLIPSILSSVVAFTSLILNIMNERKRKKDLIWQTAKEIVFKLNAENRINLHDAQNIAVHLII